jgi:hypothetical protein
VFHVILSRKTVGSARVDAFVLPVVIAIGFLCNGALHAEDALLPKPDVTPADVSPDASPTPQLAVPPPILIPEDLLPAPGATPAPAANIPTIPQLDESLKPPRLNPAATVYQLNIEWRKLRNRVQNDAQLKAALAHADAAPNDLEKRKRLAIYYEAFYGKMIALAGTPELKQFLRDRKTTSLAELKQPRVRPETTPRPGSAKRAAAAAPSPSVTPLPGMSPSPSASPTPGPLFPSVFGTPRPGQP